MEKVSLPQQHPLRGVTSPHTVVHTLHAAQVMLADGRLVAMKTVRAADSAEAVQQQQDLETEILVTHAMACPWSVACLGYVRVGRRLATKALTAVSAACKMLRCMQLQTGGISRAEQNVVQDYRSGQLGMVMPLYDTDLGSLCAQLAAHCCAAARRYMHAACHMLERMRWCQ